MASERNDRAYVYLISEVRGDFVKIGIANDVEKRLSGLQTANPRLLKIEAKTRLPDRGIALEVESHAHNTLRKRRWSGEWFCCSVADARAAIVQALAWACIKHDLDPPNDAWRKYLADLERIAA